MIECQNLTFNPLIKIITHYVRNFIFAGSSKVFVKI